MNEHEGRTLLIHGATLIDGTGAAPQTGLVVLVRGRRIAAVGPREAVSVPPGTVEVDAKGRYLLPGLIDAHVHLMHGGYSPRPPKGSRLTYSTMIAYRNLLRSAPSSPASMPT